MEVSLIKSRWFTYNDSANTLNFVGVRARVCAFESCLIFSVFYCLRFLAVKD